MGHVDASTALLIIAATVPGAVALRVALLALELVHRLDRNVDRHVRTLARAAGCGVIERPSERGARNLESDGDLPN